MATPSPIDIATPTRHPSSSPSQIPGRKLSTLTSALQNASPESTRTMGAMNINNSHHFDKNIGSLMGQRDSYGGGGGMSASSMNWSGTRPISMDRPGNEKPRRESVTGSFMGGMSWGGVSVGSWIRDDIIMAGSSPFGFQSPSFHSSSYLPKMEANFMKDFACCGLVLPSLHDLLQHYEDCHAEQGSARPLKLPGADGQSTASNVAPDNKAAIAAVAAGTIKQQADQQRLQSQSNQGNATSSSVSGIQLMRQQQHQQPPQQQQPQAEHDPSSTPQPKSIPQSSQDMDEVEDMEMDDVEEEMDEQTPPPVQIPQQSQVQQAASTNFMRPNHRTHDPLGLNTANAHSMAAQMQGLRTSQPPTPAGVGTHILPYQHNPTVSSVNTPSLANHAQQQQQQQMAQANGHYQFSPDSSVPGTPSELGNEYSSDVQQQMGNQQFVQAPSMYGFDGYMNEMPEMYIDDPAKRLFSPGGPFANQNHMAQLRMNGDALTYNPELLKRMQEQQAQQLMGNVGGNQMNIAPGEEVKPFRCPVIGCEKAYKNQNGLKYHKAHGHQTQKLFDNNDGTFSIVNPETSAPYPGTLGMEKEKPYRCDACGKRYKNLNGLKYHKAHSPPCSPEARHNAGITSENGAGQMAMHGMPLGMPSGGLGGIGEEPMAESNLR